MLQFKEIIEHNERDQEESALLAQTQPISRGGSPRALHALGSLVPSPTPSFPSLCGTKQRRKAGRGTGNEAMLLVVHVHNLYQEAGAPLQGLASSSQGSGGTQNKVKPKPEQ